MCVHVCACVCRCVPVCMCVRACAGAYVCMCGLGCLWSQSSDYNFISALNAITKIQETD